VDRVGQYLCVAIVTFADKRPHPVFPRWYGYVSIWATMTSLPPTLNVFFKSGPFAWNGALAWWLQVSCIFAWVIATLVVLLRAINQQQAEETAGLLAGRTDRNGEVTPASCAIEMRFEEIEQLQA